MLCFSVAWFLTFGKVLPYVCSSFSSHRLLSSRFFVKLLSVLFVYRLFVTLVIAVLGF